MDRLERGDGAAGVMAVEVLPGLTLEEWLVAGRPQQVSVRLAGDADLEAHYAELAAVEELVIELPVFMDGRAFSHARKLRAAGFTGALLAAGDVLPDQWQFLQRCGFTGLADKDNEQQAEKLNRFSASYQ